MLIINTVIPDIIDIASTRKLNKTASLLVYAVIPSGSEKGEWFENGSKNSNMWSTSKAAQA